MRRVPIRMKLAGALAVPLLALVVVTTLEVVQSSQDAQRVREQVTLAESSIGPVSLLSHLENERNAAAVYLLGAEDLIRSVGPGRYLETRGLVDEARQEFLDFVAGEGEQVQAIYGPALRAIAQLDELSLALATRRPVEISFCVLASPALVLLSV